MKIFFSQVNTNSEMIEEDLAPLDLKESIRKTRQALDIAYAGFDNAIESDLIDSYIYEINALQKRYQHLTELAASQPVRQEKLKRQRFRDARKPSYRHHLSAGQGKIQYNHYAQYNPVPAEGLEIVLFDKAHQEPDGQHGNDKGNHHAYQQNTQLRPREAAALHQKDQNFYAAGAQHRRNRQEKGKLSGYKTGAAKEHSAEDSSARPGGAGNQRQHLAYADQQSHLVGQFRKLFYLGLFVPAFQNQEQNAVKNQRSGNDIGSGKDAVNDVVEQNSNDAGGNAGHKHLSPQGKGVFLFPLCFLRRKRVQLMKIKHHNR